MLFYETDTKKKGIKCRRRNTCKPTLVSDFQPRAYDTDMVYSMLKKQTMYITYILDDAELYSLYSYYVKPSKTNKPKRHIKLRIHPNCILGKIHKITLSKQSTSTILLTDLVIIRSKWATNSLRQIHRKVAPGCNNPR